MAGLLLEHLFRTVLGRPAPTAAFLVVNGLLLVAAERTRRARRSTASATAGGAPAAGGPVASDTRISRTRVGSELLIGAAQIGGLLPGISRSGSAMVTGLTRGLDHEDAAGFSFLLATPVILAAGVLKLPDLAGPLGDGIRGQVVFGSVLSGVGAYVSVRFLTRWFRTRTLLPFAVYCILAGVGSLAVFAARGTL